MKKFVSLAMLVAFGLMFSGCEDQGSKQRTQAKSNLDILVTAQWYYFEHFGNQHFAVTAKQLVEKGCLPDNFTALDEPTGVVIGDYCYRMIPVKSDTNFRFVAKPINLSVPQETMVVDITGFILDK